MIRFLGLICFASIQALGVSSHHTRIAVISDEASNLQGSPLISLLEVKLSQTEGIELLERGEIEAILKEQELTLSGMLDRKNILKIGQLLRTDAFVLLSIKDSTQEKQNQKRLLRVRVTETAHGLRLLDTFEELESAKLKEIVERITKKVTAIVPKITLPPSEAIPVGIVDIHRVQLGERYQWLARTLPAMLSARLNKERRIIMLEREDLKILHDEKLLAGGEDTEFWGSAVLIEGYLRRRGIQDVEIKLSPRRASGEEMFIFTTSVELNEPSIAVKKATTNIIQELLNAPPSTSWLPKQEAEEFFRQGHLLKNHKRHKDALLPLETAHALQPQNVFYTGAIFENEWQVRYVPVNDPWVEETGISYYSDLELAELVALLVRQIHSGYDLGTISESDVIERWGNPLGFAKNKRGYLKSYFSKAVSVSTEQIRNINRENRRIWLETINKTMERRWYRFGAWPHIYTASALLSSDRPEEAMKNLKEINEKTIMLKRMGDKIRNEGGRYTWTLWIITFPGIDLSTSDKIEKTHFHGSAERFEELWEKHLIDLTKADDYIVKYVSCLALIDWYRGKKKEDVAQSYCDAALAILQNDIKVPDTGFEYRHLQSMRNEIVDRILSLGYDTEKIFNIFKDIYEPLIEQNDAYELALWEPGYPRLRRIYFENFEIAKTSISLLQRIVTVLRNYENQRDVVTQGLNRVKDTITEIKNKFPQLNIHVQEAIPSVTTLLAKANWPRSPCNFQYNRVLLQNDIIWIAFAKPGIGLCGININEKRLITLWQSDCDNGTPMSSPGAGTEIIGSITGMAINGDVSYIAIRDVGLVEFPGSITHGRNFLSSPKILTLENGLPSLSISGMTAIGNKLWIAYGKPAQESGLIAYNPKTSKYETLLCSTLKSDNPFCMGNTYEITNLTLGPKNNLFFIVKAQRENWAEINHITGLWRININSKEQKFIWHHKFERLFLESIEDSYKNWWLKGLEYLARFDPESEVITLIWISPGTRVPIAPQPQLEEDFYFHKPFPSRMIGHLHAGRVSLRTAAVHDERLWARLGKSQLITLHKGKSLQEAEIIDNNILDGDKVLRFFSTPYGLIAIGEGTVGLVERSGNL